MGDSNTKTCKICEENGIVSSVTTTGNLRTTLVMPVKRFDQTEQRWITSDPNTVTRTYMCEKGHRFDLDD